MAALVAVLGASPPAAAAAPQRPPSLTAPPAGFSLSAERAIEIAERVPEVDTARGRRPDLAPTAYTDGPGRWRISFGAGNRELVQVIVDDRTGAVTETWTGDQITWKMARGYEGAFGRKVNAPYVWLPLCLLFVAPFIDPRRPFRLLHLDLLALLAFGVSHVFFNWAEIGVSVPLVYPVLAYLLVRMLVAGLRPRARAPGPLVPVVATRWLAFALVFLVVFRVGLNIIDSNVIDVGYSGVVGADRIERGQSLYGGRLPADNPNADTYGPATYLAYVPFEQALPWSGRWDDLPAAHAAALVFDLATLAGLLVLGRRLRAGARGRRLGLALAFAWAAYPYTLFALTTNTNDALVAALLVWALVALRSPPARGALVALAAAAKFAPLALAPLFAGAGRLDRRADDQRNAGARGLALYVGAAAAVLAAAFLPFVPDGGLGELYDRTLGFQADRNSPFSIWGQVEGLEGLQRAVTAAALILALAVGLVPRRKTAGQVAALGAAVLVALQLAADHWFYLYIVWFAPLVFVALFLEHEPEADQRAAPPAPEGRRRPVLARTRAPAATPARST